MIKSLHLQEFSSVGIYYSWIKDDTLFHREEESISTYNMTEENDTNIKPEGNEHINLKVTGQDRSVVQFKIKHKTPLRKLMSAYCDRAGLNIGAVRFRFDGNPINETDTPTHLDMEDGDSIDVFQQQTGGSDC